MYSEAGQPIVISEMDYLDVKNLAQTGEGLYLEFKRTIPGEEKIAREICAFANTNGGIILVGVDDDKSLIGLQGYQEEEYILRKAAREYCKPAVTIKIELVNFGVLDLLVVNIPEASEKPVYVHAKSHSTAYIRNDEESLAASRERILILENQQSNNGVTFEYGVNEQKLFRYLNENRQISVVKFAQLINTSNRKAGEILVNLVSAGILNLSTKNNIDYFSFSLKCQS